MYQHPLECQGWFHRCHHSMVAEDPPQGLWNPPGLRQSDSDLNALLLAVLLWDRLVVFPLPLVILLPQSPRAWFTWSISSAASASSWQYCYKSHISGADDTPSLWLSVWWELKFRYWLVSVALWYTYTFTFPSSLQEISATRNRILPHHPSEAHPHTLCRCWC